MTGGPGRVDALAVVGDGEGQGVVGGGDRDVDPGGGRVPGGVGEGLGGDREELLGEVVGDGGVDRSVDAQGGAEAEGVGGGLRRLGEAAAQPRVAWFVGGAQVEDGGADDADGGVQVVRRG